MTQRLKEDENLFKAGPGNSGNENGFWRYQ